MIHLPSRFVRLETALSGLTPVVFALLLINLLFNVIANASFKVSAESSAARSFLLWQVVGNTAGFITVLTLTGLLRHMPLSVAYPLTTGLAILGVQLIAGRWFFGEVITLERLFGALLIITGILFVTRH